MFHTIGVGSLQCVDEAGRAVFDEFFDLFDFKDIRRSLEKIAEMAKARQVDVLYLPSVGMFPITMFLSNLRVAPVQLAALGHAATTCSLRMDYMMLEGDLVGDPATFTEKLIRLENDAMPIVAPAAAQGLSLVPVLRRRPVTIEIAVCSTVMKLNPEFLLACRVIADRCERAVRFQFFVGQALGLEWAQADNFVKHYLGDRASLHRHQPFGDYMHAICACDLFLSPFPYCNMNGIVDTASVGLVGICKTGPEVHEHIDEALFARLGMPKWLVAGTIEEYVAAAVRLIQDEELRLSIRQGLIARKSFSKFFSGRPDLFGEAIKGLLRGRPEDA